MPGDRPRKLRLVVLVDVTEGDHSALETAVARWAQDARFRDLAASGGGKVGAIHAALVEVDDG